MTTNRFRSLDGLRGVCALTVLLLHCDGYFHRGPIFQHGYLAVDVFFILSGFVIAYTYEDQLRAGESLQNFLRRRAQRLLPAYWIAAAMNFAILSAIVLAGLYVTRYTATMLWIVVPLSAALMLPEFMTPEGSTYPAMNNVTWSLFAEWIAYVLYACGLFRLRTITLSIIVALGWAGMTIVGYHTGTGWSVGLDRDGIFTLAILRSIPSFLAGVVIYRLHTHPVFKRLPVISTEWMLTGWLAIAALPTFTATPTMDALIVIVLCPLLICLLIRSDNKAPTFCKPLGELSYPLYVAHPGVLLLADFTPVFGLNHGPNPIGGICVVMASVALAVTVKKLAQIATAAFKPAAGAKSIGSLRV